jgi:hypothetical protein
MKKLLFIILVLLFIKTETVSQETNWFGSSTIKSIVLLQKLVNGNYVNHGVGILTTHDDYNTPIIVTCEHVLRNNQIYVVANADTTLIKEFKKLNVKTLKIRNVDWTLDGNLIRAKVDLIKNKTFVTHADGLDIAAFPFNITQSLIFKKDSSIMPISQILFVSDKNYGNNGMINLGEDTYFIGFPFGFGVSDVLEPLLRSGVVSWVSQTNNEFLLDAISYGGNSGSPVFTKMTPLNNKRLKPYFIGMVVGHYSSEYDNIGLARCVYIEDIIEVINEAKKLKNCW